MKSTRCEWLFLMMVLAWTGCPRHIERTDLQPLPEQLMDYCESDGMTGLDEDPECIEKLESICEMLREGRMEEAAESARAADLERIQCLEFVQFAIELFFLEDRYLDVAGYLARMEVRVPVNSDQAVWIRMKQEKLDEILKRKARESLDTRDTASSLQYIHIRNRYLKYDPDSIRFEAGLLRELDDDESLILLLQGIPADSMDSGFFLMLGDAFQRTLRFDEASSAFLEALRRDDSETTRRLYMNSRKLHLKSTLPENLDNIDHAPWVTRGDLAGLLTWRFNLPAANRQGLIVDISDSDARESISWIVSLGIMDIGRDYCFRPNHHITRMDLALAMAHVMEIFHVDIDTHGAVMPWDVPLSHYAFKQIQEVVAAGIMGLEDDGGFHAGTVLSGAETVTAISKLGDFIDLLLADSF